MTDPFDGRGDDIPEEDMPVDELQPESNGEDPLIAALGEEGQGDLAPEHEL